MKGLALLLLIPLVACSKPPVVTEPVETPSMCIAGMVETSPGIATIDIFADREFSPKIQTIPGVSTDLKLDLPTC